MQVTFYSGTDTSSSILGPISGSALAGNSLFTGLVCGPYVQYDFAKPLFPGAE